MANNFKLSISRLNAAKKIEYLSNARSQVLNKIRRQSLTSGQVDDITLNNSDISSIAGLNYNDLRSFSTTTEETLMAIGQYTKEYNKPKFADDTAVGTTVYSNLYKNGYLHGFIGDTSSLVKNQTGQELQNKNIKHAVMNHINTTRTTKQDMQDFNEVKEGIKNFSTILKNGGQVVAYDIESLGGTNARGHQQIDFITEIAAVVQNIAKGGKVTTDEDLSMSSLLGFSEDEYNALKDQLTKLKDVPSHKMSSKDRDVYIHRLSLLSDPQFKYKQHNSGFEHRVSNSDPDSVVDSISNAFKGLDAYREIGKKQEAWLATNKPGVSLEDYKKDYIRDVQDLIFRHKHNGTNTSLSEKAISIGYNSFNFDDPNINIIADKNVEHGYGKGVDLYQAVKNIQEHYGVGAHIPDAFRDNTLNKHGLGTQDQLKQMFKLVNKVGAHNAEEDSKALFNIFSKTIDDKGTTYLDFINNKIEAIDAKLGMLNINNLEVNKNGKQAVFLMDKTGQKNWAVNKNGLSFAYNHIDGSIKTQDGFRIDADGNVVKEKINGYGPKSGALYTHEFEEVQLDGDWKEQFRNLGLSDEITEKYYQQYAGLDKIYVMKSREYQDKKALIKKFGEDTVFEDPNTYITILTNKSQVASAAGAFVGRKNKDGSIAWDKDSLKALNLKTVTNDKGKVAIRGLSEEEAGRMILDRSMVRTSVESAARTIRELNYDRAAKIHNYANSEQVLTEGAEAVKQRISETISQMVLARKTGDMQTTQALMQHLTMAMGYEDIVTKEQILRPETIGKNTVIDKYIEALSPIMNTMEDVFSGMNIGNSQADKAKKDIIFHNVLINVLEGMANENHVMGDKNDTRLLSNGVTSVFTEDELNKVDFLRSNIFPSVDAQTMESTVAGDNSKYVSLDLSKDTGLLNLFYNNQFSDIDNLSEVKDHNAAFTALFNAYDTIGEDERFKGVWGNLSKKEVLSYQKEKHLYDLNHVMTTKLKSFVANKRSEEDNSGFGLSYVRTIQDYSNTTNIKKLLGKYDNEEITKRVTKEMNRSNIDVFMADGTDTKLIDNIVDRYFMTFSQGKLNGEIKDLSKTQQSWLKAQYEFSKKEAFNTTQDLLKSIKGTNVSLGILGSGEDARMFLKQGGNVQFLDMQKYILNNGIINHKIGDVEYATSFAYDVSKIVKRGRRTTLNQNDVLRAVNITSNVQQALNQTRSYENTVFEANARGESIIDALVYRNKSNLKMIREAGAMKQSDNFANSIKRAMYIDTNPIIGILPELRTAGIIDRVNQEYYVNADTAKSFDSLIDEIRDGKVRPDRINDLLANKQNLYFHQYINPLLNILNEEATLGHAGSVDIKKLIKSLNPHTQDTKLAAGIMSVDDNAYAHGLAKFDKTGRSVSIQTENQKLYNSEQLAKEVKELADRGLDVTSGGRVNTSAGYKYLQKNGTQTSGLTLKYLQIDSNTLKNQFVDDVKKARNGEANKFSAYLEKAYSGEFNFNAIEASKKLVEKAMNLSTYEQQSTMDARVQYAAFHKTNEQLISGRKQLITSHTENLEVIKATNKAKHLNFTIDANGNIKYQLGYEVNRDEVLGMFGQEGNVVRARYNGVFRGRVFDKAGNIITESQLSNFVKVNKLIGKGDTAIRAAIDKKYRFKYQLIKKFDDFGHKIANDSSEKSTIDTMDMAVGSIDKHLPEILHSLGLDGLKGQYLSRSYIEYMNDYLIREKHLSPDNAKTLIDRVLKERFAFSDALQDQYALFKGVSQVTALEAPKHESVSMAAANLMQKISNLNLSKEEEHKLHGQLFVGKLKYTDDGTLITDNITKINTKVKDKRLRKILSQKDEAVDEAGNIIGHYGYSHVTHLNDWEGGTYAGSGNIVRLKNQRDKVEEKIADLEQSRLSEDGLKPHEQTKLAKLIEQKGNIEHQIGAISNQKGIVFDKRANLNLQKSVWNEDSLALARENFLDKDEFEKYFGHVLNGNGKVSSAYLGNSILDPITSVMRNRTMIGFGETQLSSLKGKERRSYRYLLDSYKAIADKISVEKAEKLYSLQQGMRAIDFNENNSASRYKALTKGAEHDYNNFKEVDLSNLKSGEDGWLNLDIAGQGHTVVKAENNPYTKNLMIKTGLGGEEEFLAIARMPERHFEDSLIKTSHVRMLNGLQNKLKEIHSGTLGDKEAGAIEYARKLVQDIKKAQIHDVTSKEGLAGSLSYSRLSQSFFGKASSITYNYNKAFGKDTYKELQNLNGESFLDKAMFDGKSLLKHYSEGKAIDAIAFSEQAADAMGYFSEEMMKQAGAKNREHMVDILSTKGDTFLATRFPRNQEASDKVVMGYLDTSLKGNQLKAVGHTGASMKMDHDGDEFGIGRLTNESGESYLTMAEDSTDKFITSQKAILMERAVNDNRYWDEKIRDRVANVERKIAKSGNSIQNVAGKRLIDNQIYSAIMDSSKSAHYEGLLQEDKYGTMVKSAMSYKGDGDAHAENIAELKRIHGDNSKAFNSAKRDYVDAFRYQLYKDEFIAKSAKNSIGESNVTNMKLKEVFLGTADRKAIDYNYKSSLVSNMMYLTEEAAISAKSSIEGLDPNRASIWNSHVRDLVTSKGNAEDHIKAMKKWSMDYSIKDLDYDFFWEKSKVFRNIAAEELNNKNKLTKAAFTSMMEDSNNKQTMQRRLTDDFVNTLSSLSKIKNIEEHLDYASVGQSIVGVKKPITRPTSLKNFESPVDGMIKGQQMSHSDLNDIMHFLTVDDTVKSSKIGGPSLIDKITPDAEELEEKVGMGRKILEGANDLFKEVKGSKIAMGAVGIAAGVMMLGYVGGRPRPADTQAMEEAGTNDYQEPHQGMFGGLMDPGLAPMPMGGQQGYVVNINARSDKGKRHAISAIQQAISSGTSSSVNVAMNINDNYGNINDRDLQKAIKDAL